MAVNMKAKARQSTSISFDSEGNDVFLRALRDGSLVQADWQQAAILAGYGFMVNVGAFSTGIVGGGNGTVIDLDEPELIVSIPNGTAILPVRIGVHVQSGAPADGQEVEALIAVDQDKELDATSVAGSTYTRETIYNMNTLVSRASTCLVGSAFSDTVTDPVLDLELAHLCLDYDVPGATAGQNMQLDLVYEPLRSPVINGPAQLIVYYGGATAVVGGFIDCQWIEFAETSFTL